MQADDDAQATMLSGDKRFASGDRRETGCYWNDQLWMTTLPFSGNTSPLFIFLICYLSLISVIMNISPALSATLCSRRGAPAAAVDLGPLEATPGACFAGMPFEL
jgi:hypothetical protein